MDGSSSLARVSALRCLPSAGSRRLCTALLGGLFFAFSSTAALAATLQAESAVLAGGTVAESTNGGFHGTGYANSSANGGTTTFNNVNGEGGGAKSLAIRYANGGTTTRTG